MPSSAGGAVSPNRSCSVSWYSRFDSRRITAAPLSMPTCAHVSPVSVPEPLPVPPVPVVLPTPVVLPLPVVLPAPVVLPPPLLPAAPGPDCAPTLPVHAPPAHAPAIASATNNDNGLGLFGRYGISDPSQVGARRGTARLAAQVGMVKAADQISGIRAGRESRGPRRPDSNRPSPAAPSSHRPASRALAGRLVGAWPSSSLLRWPLLATGQSRSRLAPAASWAEA